MRQSISRSLARLVQVLAALRQCSFSSRLTDCTTTQTDRQTHDNSEDRTTTTQPFTPGPPASLSLTTVRARYEISRRPAGWLAGKLVKQQQVTETGQPVEIETEMCAALRLRIGGAASAQAQLRAPIAHSPRRPIIIVVVVVVVGYLTSSLRGDTRRRRSGHTLVTFVHSC